MLVMAVRADDTDAGGRAVSGGAVVVTTTRALLASMLTYDIRRQTGVWQPGVRLQYA